MSVSIRQYRSDDLSQLQELVVLAFEPIFASFAEMLGPQIYAALYPDWKTLERDLVTSLCNDPQINVWVADSAGIPVGMIAYRLNEEKKIGEIEFLMVHPDYQNAGIGTRLNEFALTKLQEAGMVLAEIGTGGDPGHAPARRAYEKTGLTPFPLVRYFKYLNE